jgi:hypothetical protein
MHDELISISILTRQEKIRIIIIKLDFMFGENRKKVVSSLKSVKLYFDNFHCEIIKYNFHG